eukprot:GSMAST32.ASY1.ANO1.62.1 assembled CDS
MPFHEAFYFIIVTFSTVGYGDISPATTEARMTMVVSICVAFATIPSKVALLYVPKITLTLVFIKIFKKKKKIHRKFYT